MGVRGLARFCAQHEAQTSRAVESLQDVTLAVDFAGFHFYVCEQVAKNIEEQCGIPASMWLLLGGCPLRLEQFVDAWLQRLEAARIALVVVADPPQCFLGTNHSKTMELQDRAQQKIDKLRQLRDGLFETSSPPPTRESASPPPASPASPSKIALRADKRDQMASLLSSAQSCFPFSREKIRSILKRRGARMVTAMREADDELAQLVRDGQAFAVLSNDSDFLVMKGVQYIPFHKLKVDDRRGVSARVFSPELVARALELTPLQLVDLALLCTNDYTHQLDTTYHFSRTLGFPRPSTIRNNTETIAPDLAALHIRSQLTPILDDPRLRQLAATYGAEFTDKLGEIYVFYGYASEFTRRFAYTPPRRAIADADVAKYKKLLDLHEYSTSLIDALHSQSRRMKQQVDLLATAHDGSKSLIALLEPVRSLVYGALALPRVKELWYDPHTGKRTQTDVVPLKMPFLEAFFAGKKSQMVVEQTWRSMVFAYVFGDANGLENAAFLWKLIGKDAPSAKSVVASLALLWRCDADHLPDPTTRLVTMETLEVLLLTAIVCSAMKKDRVPPPYDFDHADFALDWRVYASVNAFLEVLRAVQSLRVVLGERRMPTAKEPLCPSLFSAEVFLPVYAIVKSTKDPKTAALAVDPLAGHALSRAQVDSVLCYYVSDLEDDARTKQWDLFCRLRAVLNRFVELSNGSMSGGATASAAGAAAAPARSAPLPPPPPSFVPPLPPGPPPPLPPAYPVATGNGTRNAMVPPTVAVQPSTNGGSATAASTPRSTPKSSKAKKKKDSNNASKAQGRTVRGADASPTTPTPSVQPAQPQPVTTPAPVTGRTTPSTRAATATTTTPLLTPAAVTKRLGKTQPKRKPHNNNNRATQPPLPPRAPPVPKEQSLQTLLQRLPVFAHRDEILKNVMTNQLTIIQGETGCGKSTSVPQFILDDWLNRAVPNERPVNIFVTQPRRIAAMELAKTVTKMREGNAHGEDGTLGKVVGYRIGQKHEASSSTKITYVTTGYMVERLIHDHDTLQGVTHLVLDEVHERSMDVDALLLLLKLQLPKHPHLRLVIMSATMDARVLLQYFGKGLKLTHRKPLFVGTKLFPVENVFLEDVAHLYPQLAHRQHNELMRIHSELAKVSSKRAAASSEQAQNMIAAVHDAQLKLLPALLQQLLLDHHHARAEIVPQCILVFVPGIGSINKLYDELTAQFSSSFRGVAVSVTVLHSSLEMDQQQAAFDRLHGQATKIVLATNVAESSVTIPDVTHVVNCGMEKQIQMPNARSTHAEVLVDVWCSRASVQQRAGRAGRLMAGVAVHLFPRDFYLSSMAEFTTPEILRKPLDRLVLQLKAKFHDFGVPSALLKQAMDAPDLSHIDGAYKRLAAFDALDSTDEDAAKITPFGTFLGHLPLTMELCRLVLVGTSVTPSLRPLVLANLVVVVAVLASPSLFVQPSWFHVQAPRRYMAEMKANLRAKLTLDAGCAGSEPLAIWRFYMALLAQHSLTRRPHVLSAVRDHALSTKRWQSLNLLLADTCARLVAQDTVALDAASIDMLRALEAYASSQRVTAPLLAMAQAAVDDRHRESELLRFLVVHNFADQLLVAKLSEGSHYDDDGDDVIAATDRVDLTMGAEDSRLLLALPASERKKVLAPLAETDGAAFANIAYAKQELSLYAKAAEGATALSFPVALAFYIKDNKFPVDFSIVLPDGTEQRIRTRVSDTSASSITWSQAKDGGKVNIGGRSLLALPLRSPPPASPLAAVYTDRLYTGSEAKMYCHKLTLLPPTAVAYRLVVQLATAHRHANVWLQVDRHRDEIVAVKLDRQVLPLPPRTALSRLALHKINALRRALSASLQCLPVNDPEYKVLDVDAVLELCRDEELVVRWTREEARGRQYDWQQLVVVAPTRAEMAERRACGLTEPRYPLFEL